MSYDFARYPMTYNYTALTWTADKIIPIIGPKGVRGRLIDVGAWGVTTTFAGGTTTPKAKIGTTSGGAETMVAFDFGALTVAVGAKSVRSTYDKQTDIDTYFLNDGKLAADTVQFIDLVAATGGGAAGVSNAFVLVYWGA